MDVAALPGGDWVARGLSDLDQRVDSVSARLGGDRDGHGCGRVGFRLPIALPPAPEKHLYRLLDCQHADAAHAHTTALIRYLVAFERAASSPHPTISSVESTSRAGPPRPNPAQLPALARGVAGRISKVAGIVSVLNGINPRGR